MKRNIFTLFVVLVLTVSSYGVLAADTVTETRTTCEVHEYVSTVTQAGDCKKDKKIERICEQCKVAQSSPTPQTIEIPAKHDWVLGEDNKLVCGIDRCKKKPSISASLTKDDQVLFDGSSCDVNYYKDDEDVCLKVDSNCSGYELKCNYNKKYLKVEKNENGEYVIKYVKYYPFKTDFMDYFIEFYFIAEDEEVEDKKYSFTIYPTCTKYVGLNKTEILIKKGKKATLKATVLGATKATFTTSNKKVVKIVKKKAKKVVVKGVGKGTADITAKVAGKSATCKVTVK